MSSEVTYSAMTYASARLNSIREPHRNFLAYSLMLHGAHLSLSWGIRGNLLARRYEDYHWSGVIP